MMKYCGARYRHPNPTRQAARLDVLRERDRQRHGSGVLPCAVLQRKQGGEFGTISALTLARMQFAFTVSFHFVFPANTIGLASY